MLTLASRVRAQLDDSHPLLQLATALARMGALYHRACLEGVGNLPSGPVLLVGNHGLFGLDTPVFFYLLKQHTGRHPFGLADRRVFGFEPVKSLLERVGGVTGTPQNALGLLQSGGLVVCYPGGAREVFKAPGQRYRLSWSSSVGFARVAVRAAVPVVPFAGLGVDHSFLPLGHLPLARRVLGKYSVPVSLGLGPLPLPARFRFRLGAPLWPPSTESGAAEFKERVRLAVEDLLG